MEGFEQRSEVTWITLEHIILASLWRINHNSDEEDGWDQDGNRGSSKQMDSGYTSKVEPAGFPGRQDVNYESKRRVSEGGL